MFISTQIKSKLKKLLKKVKSLLVTPSSGMFLCCTNLAWNTWINGLVYFTKECFDWMLLSQTTKWENVEPYLEYLHQKNVSIDEAKLFDQCHSLCKFIET